MEISEERFKELLKMLNFLSSASDYEVITESALEGINLRYSLRFKSSKKQIAILESYMNIKFYYMETSWA